MASTEISRIEYWYFDFNRDIKLAFTATIFDEKVFTDMTMVKILDCFHYIVTLLCYVMELAGMVLQIRQVFGKFADCAVHFANWQIGQIGILDGTYTCNMYVIACLTVDSRKNIESESHLECMSHPVFRM